MLQDRDGLPRCHGLLQPVDEEWDELVGLVTDYDIRRVLESEQNIFSLNIADIMNAKPAVVLAGEKAVRALEIMRDRKKPTAVLPVIDDSRKAVGMIHLHDLISAGL